MTITSKLTQDSYEPMTRQNLIIIIIIIIIIDGEVTSMVCP